MSWQSGGNQVFLFLSFSHTHLTFLSPASQIPVSFGSRGIWLEPLCLLTLLGWHRRGSASLASVSPTFLSSYSGPHACQQSLFTKCPGPHSYGASRPVALCYYRKAQTSGKSGSGLPVETTNHSGCEQIKKKNLRTQLKEENLDCDRR